MGVTEEKRAKEDKEDKQGKQETNKQASKKHDMSRHVMSSQTN